MSDAHREVPTIQDETHNPLAVNWDEYIPVEDNTAGAYPDTMDDAIAEKNVDDIGYHREAQILDVLDQGRGAEPVKVTAIRHSGRLAARAAHPSAQERAHMDDLDKAA